MPTTNLTDTEKIEILAVRGMGWEDLEDCWGKTISKRRKGVYCLKSKWNPLIDLNAIHEVEERLTEEQQDEYVLMLEKRFQFDTWELCHASPAVCAEALCRVLAPEKFL